MQLLTTAIVALTLTHTGAAHTADAVPEYTRERTRELCDLVRKSKYGLYVALLHLASGDPAEATKGEHTRLEIDCARVPRPLRFTKPPGPFTVIVNDQDVTAAVKPLADGLLEVALPGNDQPDAMHARLDIRVETDLAALANKGRGSMLATVHNVSDPPAVDVMAVPFLEGFIRHFGCGVRTIERLVPNASRRLSWGLTGTLAGKHGAFRVAAGAVNAPTVASAAQ